MTATINLDCNRGDTANWTITASEGGFALDLTEARLIMCARRNYASPILFERTSDADGGIVIDPDQVGHRGQATITLKANDTLQLENDTLTLVYTIHVVSGANDWTIARGNLVVSPIAWDGVS